MPKILWRELDGQRPPDHGRAGPASFQQLRVGPASDRSAEPIASAIFPELASGRSSSVAEEAAHARQMLRKAEREAQGLIEAAKQKAALMAQEAYREGQLQGRAEALEEARTQFRQLAAALEEGVRRLHTLEEEFRAQASQIVVRLALAVAERICRAQIAQDPEVALRAVKATLVRLPELGEITIRVHPNSLPTIHEHQAELLGLLGGKGDLRFAPDPSVEVGGCLVETPGCLADATLAGQLEEACRRLLGEPW